MGVTAVVGLQYGDEGKGKIVDYLSKTADVVCRFQGGCNAGHTIVRDGKVYKLHLLPTGVLSGKISVIGNGVVLDVVRLAEELKSVELTNSLFIAAHAHVTLPSYLEQDKDSTSKKVGTTGRGIGPTYTAKIARKSYTLQYLWRHRSKLLEAGEITTEMVNALEYIWTHDWVKVSNYIPYFINEFINKEYEILLEGAQGTLLDVDHGTYPYVTSSNCIAGAACTGLGIGPNQITKVIGVTKAYTTRVGNGPFDTELCGEMGELIRTKGGEFGTTTGRPRRCGWLSRPELDYACMINGVTDLIVTKVDVLNSMAVYIGAGYLNELTEEPFSSENIITTYSPSLRMNQEMLYEVYNKSWEITSGHVYNTINELPENLQTYLANITNWPCNLMAVSYGQDSSALALR